MPFIVPSDNQDFDIFMDKTDNFTDKILLIQTVKRDDVGIVPYSYPIKWRLSNSSNEVNSQIGTKAERI